jgi:hypothetical protein
LEDISGPHKFSVTRFARHDIFLFGTQELHVFVITSPTSEGQVAKTLADLAATMGESPPISAPTVTGRNNDKSMTAAMTSTMAHKETPVDRQKFSPAKSRPESIAMLQGYLMALEAGYTIQDETSGYYKIKASQADAGFAWSTLEKLSLTFRDRIEINDIAIDTDGKLFIRISLK